MIFIFRFFVDSNSMNRKAEIAGQFNAPLFHRYGLLSQQAVFCGFSGNIYRLKIVTDELQWLQGGNNHEKTYCYPDTGAPGRQHDDFCAGSSRRTELLIRRLYRRNGRGMFPVRH